MDEVSVAKVAGVGTTRAGARTWFRVASACFCCEDSVSGRVQPHGLVRVPYRLAAALKEGAHSSVQLFDSHRHVEDL
jgi:hypothetical protein